MTVRVVSMMLPVLSNALLVTTPVSHARPLRPLVLTVQPQGISHQLPQVVPVMMVSMIMESRPVWPATTPAVLVPQLPSVQLVPLQPDNSPLPSNVSANLATMKLLISNNVRLVLLNACNVLISRSALYVILQ